MGKSSGLGIIALIIGAAGLGLGAFIMITGGPQGPAGQDGIDGKDAPGYYCVSAEEVQQALDTIGTGNGIITIMNDITLNDTIDIIGGGNYIIQGVGVTLKCASDKTAFNITNAKLLIIQNIKINTSEVVVASLNIIRIEEANNNPIYIRNVQIIGDSNTTARGLYILSDNVWVSECYFYKLDYAIWQNGGSKSHIYCNVIDDLGSGGIRLTGNNNFLDGNLINNTGSYGGIWTESLSHYNSITNNIIYYFDFYGIRISSDYNKIVGNHIQYNNVISEGDGIRVEGDYNSIVANGCYNIVGFSITNGYGIFIASGFNNTVVGNTCLFNEFPFYDFGTDTYVSGNQFS